MALSNVSFRMDEELKTEMEQVCKELGMNMSTAFVIYANKMVRERRIPFEVSVDPFYSESNLRYLENKAKDFKDGKLAFAEHDLAEE